MSTKTLSERIDAALKGKSDSREIADVIAACNDREQAIYARWAEIDEAKKTADIDTMARLNAEAETLRYEHTELNRQWGKLPALHEAAQQREAPALASALLKSFPAALEKAEQAKAAWLAARAELNQHLGDIAQQRGLSREAKFKTKAIDEAQFNRVVAVLDWLEQSPDFSTSETKNRLSRVATQRSMHLDEDPMVAYQKVYRHSGFPPAPAIGLTWAEDTE
jgi:hypothetical protein